MLRVGFGYCVDCFFCRGYAKKQVVDGCGEGCEFASAANLRYYFVVLPDSLNLQSLGRFEVVR